MENLWTGDSIDNICRIRPLTPRQRDNVRKVLSIAKVFGEEARLASNGCPEFFEPDIVLESGHQPNFIPYSGVFKKVFLLHWLAKQLKAKGHMPVALFGFADQNLSTASFLTENIIPFPNKNGYEKIGFKLKEKDRWKCFNTLEKPPREVWRNELEKIETLYLKHYKPGIKPETGRDFKEGVARAIGLLSDCYDKARNFPDLNSYFFARFCANTLNLNVFFFRYSDIQKNGIFIDEWRKLSADTPRYNVSYNIATEKNSLPIHTVENTHLPFWYHCECGGKAAISRAAPDIVQGKCPVCHKDLLLPIDDQFRNVDPYFASMSLTAVARNLVFSQGLGTHLFVSGAGGGLQYGRIAQAVAHHLNITLPVTVAWISRDFYLGRTHENALNDFMRLFSLTKDDLTGTGLAGKIRTFQDTLHNTVLELEKTPAEKKTFQKYNGQYRNSKVQLDILKKMFAIHPSLLDIAVNVEPQKIIRAWDDSIALSTLTGEEDVYKIRQDTVYSAYNSIGIHDEGIRQVYRNIDAIEVDKR